MIYTYNCSEFPGMDDCPASVTAATREELWAHVELHGRIAHQEDPAEWSAEDREEIQAIIDRNSEPAAP